ncbi:FtsX-like permease family protein [Streptomyces virginiae]|uniref:FtsX-like permease family protein n=1 Tax=Streptomyces virginiae TaxID=1961 RepID=UPI0033304991
MNRDTAVGRAGATSWARDLTLGIRFAVGGGKESWARTLLTAVGVGLGVTLLFMASALPAIMDSRTAREAARDDMMYMDSGLKPSTNTLLITAAGTIFHDDQIRGRLLKPEGFSAPVPPGLNKLPGPGEMAASPQLARVLAAPGNQLLRERLPYRITATIGEQGLIGPGELAYYAGSADLTEAPGTYRIDHFGSQEKAPKFDPIVMLLLVMALTVLLMPVAVFITTAVRFGGERRDRRLAALRLVGADIRMTRRIAAGEALLGSLIGLASGAGLFPLMRHFIGSVTLYDTSVFPSAVLPNTALAVLISLGIPTTAVLATIFALRRLSIEPLGVMRNTIPKPRRLWWRLMLPALGVALLLPLSGKVGSSSSVNEYQVAAGVVLLLSGMTAVLPWLVEVTVRRFRGGPVAWQLATRRLQLNADSAARMVSGITVAVAGAIAVQTLFTGMQDDYTAATGQDTSRAQLRVTVDVRNDGQADQVTTALRTTPGVQAAMTTIKAYATADRASDAGETTPGRVPMIPVTVADCATLQSIAHIDTCQQNSVFLIPGVGGDTLEPTVIPPPGGRIDLNASDGRADGEKPRLWTIPATARTVQARVDASGYEHHGILATPGALNAAHLSTPRAVVLLQLDPQNPQAIEHARNTAVRIDPTDPTITLHNTKQDEQFASVQRGLRIGAIATLLVIGASLLVSMLEQLRERKRLLAALVAFGAPRRVLALSVLLQTMLTVALGLTLALSGGLGLAAILLKSFKQPLKYDWASIAQITTAGGAVVILVTVLSLPPLWRMMRPNGLRTG